MKEKIHYFEELFKNNSNVFATLKEEHVLEVEELTSTIISLKQRCKKLQYDSKQGNQTKKKNAKEEYGSRSHFERTMREHCKRLQQNKLQE